MVAQAREPLADCNGRPRVVTPAKGGNPDEDPRNLEIRRLKHTIYQMKKSKDDRDRQSYYEQAKFKSGNRTDLENTSPEKKHEGDGQGRDGRTATMRMYADNQRIIK